MHLLLAYASSKEIYRMVTNEIGYFLYNSPDGTITFFSEWISTRGNRGRGGEACFATAKLKIMSAYLSELGEARLVGSSEQAV